MKIKNFCNKNQYDTGKMINKIKLIRFFQKKVFNRAKKTQKVHPLESDENEDQDPQTLKYNFITGYKTTLIDL